MEAACDAKLHVKKFTAAKGSRGNAETRKHRKRGNEVSDVSAFPKFPKFPMDIVVSPKTPRIYPVEPAALKPMRGVF
jgi:hypothetical protein